jgi:hypothetical protein
MVVVVVDVVVLPGSAGSVTGVSVVVVVGSLAMSETSGWLVTRNKSVECQRTMVDL